MSSQKEKRYNQSKITEKSWEDQVFFSFYQKQIEEKKISVRWLCKYLDGVEVGSVLVYMLISIASIM